MPDTRAGSTLAMHDFADFNVSFNQLFKVSIAALAHTRRVVSGDGGGQIMRGLITDTEEPWSNRIDWDNPDVLVADALANAVLLGIVQVCSAVDHYCASIEGEAQSWRSRDLSRGLLPAAGQNDSDSDERLVKLCRNYGWSTGALDPLLPILYYFRSARNCVVHRSGLASRALEAASRATELATALELLSDRTDAAIPVPPAFGHNSRICMPPRFAIMYLTASYRACQAVNRAFVDELGLPGLVYLAARSSLMGEELPGNVAHCGSAEAVVNFTLVDTYRVVDIEACRTVPTLRDMGLWNACRDAFARLTSE